jgi:hypothetical protein
MGNGTSNPSALTALNISGLRPSSSKLLIVCFFFASAANP